MPNKVTSIADIPSEIILAANKVESWMAKNGMKNWKLCGVADRSYTEQLERENEGLPLDSARSDTKESKKALFRAG